MKKKLLLVEDDAPSRDAMVSLLNQLGHEVQAVWSAEDAKAILEVYTPDIALLDMRLPGIPGDAFAIFLKRKCPGTRIIFISGEHQLEQPKRFGEDVVFIPKPIDFERLIQAIG